jgi:hypothetical protein
MSAITVPLLLGCLLMLRWNDGAVAGVAVVVGLVASLVAVGKPLYDNRAFPMEDQYRAEVRAVWADVAPALAAGRRPGSLLLVADLDVFAPLNGVADRAARRGWHVHVAPSLVPYYGREFASQGGEDVSLFVTRSAPPPPGAVPLGDGRGRGIRSYRLPSASR